MKIIQISLFILFHYASFSQHIGNQVYNNQAQNFNASYLSAKQVAPIKLTDSSILVTTRILKNVKAEKYLVVFGLSQEEETVAACNLKMKERILNFKDALKKLGIVENQIYVDMISQIPVYEHFDLPNYIEEIHVGFELMKNVMIHLEKIHLLDQIMEAASNEGIFDLIKVDYILEHPEQYFDELFSEAASILDKKKDRFARLCSFDIEELAIPHSEAMNVFFPKNRYVSYKAFSTTKWALVDYKRNKPIKSARKLNTKFYDPIINHGNFDKVIGKIPFAPEIQILFELKVEYRIKK